MDFLIFYINNSNKLFFSNKYSIVNKNFIINKIGFEDKMS